MSASQALDGLRVVELCGSTAGAYAGKILADLGAEVVKMERVSGDIARSCPPFPPEGASPETSSRFIYLNTGKQSVLLDDAAGDGSRLQLLCREADVVITDDSVDLGAVGEIPTSVVLCSITPFGRSGPYAGFKGRHLTIFHAGGEGHLLPSGAGWEMFPDRAPVQLGSDVGDYDTGANAAVAILAACLRQRASAEGEQIDISAQEAQLTLNRTRLSRFNHDGIELRRGPSQYGIAGMIRCRDGYVQLVGVRDEHWERLASVPEGQVFAAAWSASKERADGNGELLGRALHEWCASRSKDEVTTVFATAGCPVGAYATPADLVASDQLLHRSFFQQIDQAGIGRLTLPGVPYILSKTPVRLRPAPRLGTGRGFSPRTEPPSAGSGASPGRPPFSGPLEGIRVLDFTWAAAGPYATLLLALLGAEVVKVESSRRLDPARRGFMADYGGVNRSPNFDELNLNKRSFQVDLTHPTGLDLVRRLVAISDVVVNNFRPGVMARYGLDAERLLAEHPNLIVASSSANGSTGPEAAGAGLASIFGATGGLSEQTGYADGPPSEVGESTDYRSANALAIAILAALLHRQRTGEGQAIDLASREVVIATAPDALLAHLCGAEWQPRVGNEHRQWVPHSLYPCAGTDEWIAIVVSEQGEWAALCNLLGKPEWDRTFPNAESRAKARKRIDHAITDWTSTRPPDEAFLLLQRHGIAAAPSFTNKQLASDPHIESRGVFVEVEHPEIGRHLVMRAPWLMSRSECAIRRHGPLLGQDNTYVLETLLGIPASTHPDLEEAFR